KKLHKITRDHSYVQELIDKGIISEEEAFAHPYRNIVLESIGGIMDYRFIDVRTYKEQYCDDDIYLICSDGLFDMLDKKEIESSFAQTLDESVSNLLNKTFDKGAKDNISIILFRISKC
ncbi:MAG: PP2C family protein-serine/threonine phosphatase, partial [Planctomycetota bacterium]